MFLVIEGDNGTGKDTLALGLAENSGFSIITNREDTIELKREAKKYTGSERIKKFAEYSKFCSSIVSSHARNAKIAVVRYWLSTVAAGYADRILSYEQSMEYERRLAGLERPSAVIFLECGFAERKDRIVKRAAEDFDDLTLLRSDRYKWYLADFQNRLRIPFIRINTTNKRPAEVLDTAVKYIRKLDC